MGWPTTKQEFIDRIDKLREANLEDTIRPEQARQNTILINAFKKDLRLLIEEEE